MKCPVCGFEISDKALKCPDCSFNNFRFEFINLTEYDNWMLQTVIPHRDRFVEELLDSANSYLEIGKELMNEAEAAAEAGKKISKENERMRNMAIEMVDRACKGITEMSTEWLLKSAIKIEYIEHMGYFEAYDDYIYSFDLTKHNPHIKFQRSTFDFTEHCEYTDENIICLDFLKKAFVDVRIQDFIHTASEEFCDDGAWWELHIQLKYPVIEADFSDETYWKHQRNANGEGYCLSCDGQFNGIHFALMSLIGEYKDSISRKNKIRVDNEDIFNNDIW